MSSAPPPPYVVLSENSGSLQPPPYRRNVPRYQSTHHHKSGRGRRCLKCVCCCYCFLFLFLFLISSLVLYFYTFYKPQIPTYQVQDLDVQSFDLQPDFSLLTEFLVTVRAENPNENIGFIYGKDSTVTVSYKDSTLCTGNLPSFHQGHKNITMIKVLLRGKSEFGSGLQETLMQNKNSGHIPLLVEVNMPVSIVVAEIPTRQFTVFVNCSLVVDNLSPNKKIGILSSEYDVGFSLRV
ncbi:hypothetical protein CEY00_Acc13810 [Actinidia chinensis var. chinensis]|uniref:Late embryogenesis abundant protein LEA-2 subgroup domain-containing protein n=1 Tax=Actinidia chinensis var. chinensis TaxID=1590841 RepID=A0A2R6QX28_ACTCC|nr:hypothetical protein CEY00_Acc13810 [Actinidia chinensis var. chinensis]